MKKKTVALTSALFLLLSIACGVPQEQFDALATDLEGRKTDLIGMQERLTGMQARISELQDASTVAASVVLSLERDISKLQGELEDSETLLSDTESELNAKSDQFVEAEESITTLSDNLEARDEEIKGLSQEVEGLSQEVEELIQQVAVSDDSVADLEQSLASRDAELEVSDDSVADLEQSLASRDAELEDSQEEIDSLGFELGLANEAKSALNSQVADLQTQVSLNSEAGIQAEIDALIRERDLLVTKVSQLATLTEEYISDPDIEINTSGLACTGSMLPILHCGDIVIMRTNLQHRDIQEGDIISFQRRDCFTGRTVTGSTILHRVIDIDSGWFVTRGDNNYTVDSCRMPISNVTGKLLAYIEDIYPEHYMATSNYEAIKTDYNDLQERFDRDLAKYQEQLELLEDAEDDYNDDRISFSSYKNIWEDTEDDRLSLNRLVGELEDLATTFFALQDMIINGTYQDANWAHMVN
jgi:signal peptidase I